MRGNQGSPATVNAMRVRPPVGRGRAVELAPLACRSWTWRYAFLGAFPSLLRLTASAADESDAPRAADKLFNLLEQERGRSIDPHMRSTISSAIAFEPN